MKNSEEYKKHFISAVTIVGMFLVVIRLIMFREGISPSHMYRTLGQNPQFILIALAAGTFIGIVFGLIKYFTENRKHPVARWIAVVIVLGLLTWGAVAALDCWADPELCFMNKAND